MDAQIAQMEKTRRFYHVRTCGVHKGGEIKKLTEKRRKKWLVNLRLRSGGADRIMLVDILFFFFSNCFPIAYSEMTGILSELVSGGLGFHHETQLPERILQSEDASCVIMVIYILRFIY